MPSHVVIGGGISGLAACWYLAKAGCRPFLIEKQQRLGGVIRTDIVEDCVIEGGPDSFLASKPAAMELIRDLGLECEVIGSNDHKRVTYIVKNGRLIPMPEGLTMMVPTKPWPMAASPLLSWGTKIRMGLEYFRGPRAVSGERSVAQMIREHYGQEAVDYLAEPLLAGVYGGDPEELSADAVLGPFVEMERQYGSLTKGMLARASIAGPVFRTLKGGMEQLVAALAVQMAGKWDRRTDEVRSIRKSAQGFELELRSEKLQAEQVFVCCPAQAAGRMLKTLDPELSGALEAVKYNSSVTAALGFKQEDVEGKIDGFGFLVPKVERQRLVACTFVKTKFDHRIPAAKAVLRCFLGGGAFSVNEGQLLAEMREELRRYLGVTAAPVFTQVTRWENAMAQYTVGHRGRIDRIRGMAKQYPGLHLAGNVFEGIGIPDCIRSARDCVESL